MYTPVYTRQFAKDVQRCRRRGKNIEKLKIVIRSLLAGEPLDPIYRDRRLVGNFIGRRECHIEPDWLLVYRAAGNRMYFERMGTHSDLFKT
jgi:mRNA interferase YafQ